MAEEMQNMDNLIDAKVYFILFQDSDDFYFGSARAKCFDFRPACYCFIWIFLSHEVYK